ncbi:hypothetical protein CSA17_02230 [bacterium DOLJORAL78_65_58]|nr:MAG: hypothetical protein CSA17_02230 [bacterium DOLJORAL78_65_58]
MWSMSRSLSVALLISPFLCLLPLAGCSGGGDTITSPDGVPIAFDKVGDGDITLVLVHGWCCDRGYWQKQVAGLSDRFTIVTLDLAGHGQSGLQRDDYTMEAFGRDVAAVVNGLDLQNVYLVGHSMGGPVIVEAAPLLEGRLLGLIGIDTLQEPRFVLEASQIDAFLQPMRENFPAAVDGFARGMFPADADTALVDKVARDMASAPPEVALSAMRHMLINDLSATLRQLDLPIFCLDANMRPIDFEAWKMYPGGYTAVVMEGVGHFLFMEDAEGFNAKLVELVDRMQKYSAKEGG